MPTIAELLAAKSTAAAPAKSGAAAQEAAAKKSLTPGLKIREADRDPEPAEKSPEVEIRSLSSTCGEAIPMTPVNAPPDVLAWDSALNAFATELCVMEDPNPEAEHVWLAVRRIDRQSEPILLYRLPLFPHPQATRRPNEPF